MSGDADHRSLAVGYFNGTWDLIDATTRTPEQNLEMLTRAFASRQHWVEAGGTDENLAVADWQVAHVASLAGFTDVADAFSASAYDRARSANAPTWLQASTSEGRARACAAMHDIAGYERYAAETRDLLAKVTDLEDKQLVESQLQSIPPP
jgi:hypothetical protein